MEMEVNGLSAAAFEALWRARGADDARLGSDTPLYAYQLGGFYAFSATDHDQATITQLRAKVKFLLEDAPSLQGRITPDGPVDMIDLVGSRREIAPSAAASELMPLANCGKNLTRVPVVLVDFGAPRGRVILSQLLTAGRLLRDDHPLHLYEIGHDPAAEQLVLNLVALARPPNRKP